MNGAGLWDIRSLLGRAVEEGVAALEAAESSGDTEGAAAVAATAARALANAADYLSEWQAGRLEDVRAGAERIAASAPASGGREPGAEGPESAFLALVEESERAIVALESRQIDVREPERGHEAVAAVVAVAALLALAAWSLS